MTKSIQKKIFTVLMIWIFLYVCHLYYKDYSNNQVKPTHERIINKHKIQYRTINDTKPMKYVFKGKKIASYAAEIDRHFSATPCQSPPFLLLVINSHARHKLRRDNIRKTWGFAVSHKGSDNLPAILWRTVFIVGVVNDSNVMTQLYEEAKSFNDLVISNINENHRHLTNKTVLGMIWAQLYCHPMFFFKGDDDIWVNQFSLYKYGKTANQSKDVATFWKGFIAIDNRKPIRNKHNKYYLSIDDFESDEFPPFCSGFAYIMSSHALQAMIAAIKDIKFIPKVDDVYVGFLANKSGIQPKTEPGFHYITKHRDLKKEAQSALAKHHVLTISQQIKLRDLSYRYHIDQLCNTSSTVSHLDSNYFKDFQLFFHYNFKRKFNCSNFNSVT